MGERTRITKTGAAVGRPKKAMSLKDIKGQKTTGKAPKKTPSRNASTKYANRG